jgi:hypothetical protein
MSREGQYNEPQEEATMSKKPKPPRDPAPLADILARRLAITGQGGSDAAAGQKGDNKKLTAEEYLRRYYFIRGEGDEAVYVNLLWRSRDDGKGRARINYYSPSQAKVTRSVLVLIWHDDENWLHEEIVTKSTRVAIQDQFDFSTN